MPYRLIKKDWQKYQTRASDIVVFLTEPKKCVEVQTSKPIFQLVFCEFLFIWYTGAILSKNFSDSIISKSTQT